MPTSPPTASRRPSTPPTPASSGCAPSRRRTASPASASATPSATPDLIKAFDKVRNHFGVGRIAQAGALAALADQRMARRRRRDGSPPRATRIAAIARANGLAPLPSATNFVTIDCGRDGAFARRVLTASSPAASSCACRAWPRRTAASASAAGPTRTAPSSPPHSPKRSPCPHADVTGAPAQERRHRKYPTTEFRSRDKCASPPLAFALAALPAFAQRAAKETRPCDDDAERANPPPVGRDQRRDAWRHGVRIQATPMSISSGA